MRIVDNSRRALRVLSPACNDRVVVDGGSFNMVIMSRAAWRRKASRSISGKVISVGKNVTVSTSH